MEINIGFGVSIEKKPEAFVIKNWAGEEKRLTKDGTWYRLKNE